MIPVHVVTGFLGSGKTTLLREVLARPEFGDTAVIVNEFGAVGVDHHLLEAVKEGVLLLASGCVCCTIRSDLRDTIRDLQDRAARGAVPPFRRLVIETTGLADPAPIVSTLAAEPVIRHHFRLGSILCTVDGVAGAATLDAQPEASKQAAVADRILITKCDLAAPAAVETLAGRLAGLNPIARVMRSVGRGFDADALFPDADGAPGKGAGSHPVAWPVRAAQGEPTRAEDPRAFVLTVERPIDWVAFGAWLSALLHRHGARILRVKGILRLRESETPVLLDAVQHSVHPPRHLRRSSDEERRSHLVFIVRGLDEAPIRASLAVLLAAMERTLRPQDSGERELAPDAAER